MDLSSSDGMCGAVIWPCNCYKSSGLEGAILDLTQTANFRDRYVLGDQLGWGRFGIIRECSDKVTGEVLACKSIAKDRLITEDDARSVKLEIEILTKLAGHKNVVELKAVYEEEDYVHLLMELCAGGELFHWIEKRERLSEHEAHIIFKQLMKVVTYCHEKGIVHRDLKPENILLVSRSPNSPIKVADFGLATYVKPGQILKGTVGSPFYIAPEVLVEGYNQAADVWSAGVILYILLSGVPPFWGKTKSAIFDAVCAANLCFHSDPWDRISTSAKDLISGMLCLDPSKRLTATQVLAHSWTKDTKHNTQESPGQDDFSHTQPEVGSYSFSNFVGTRDQDLSFSDRSPFVVSSEQEDSPVFSCRSSFSTATVTNTPSSEYKAICFDSSVVANAPEFSSPLPLMPSFSFLSPILALEPSDESLLFKTKMLSIDGVDSSVRKLILSPETKQHAEHKFDEQSECCNGGCMSLSKASKRNLTIGLGELEHVDVITAAASVSRWASCTQISSALRSSLVY